MNAHRKSRHAVACLALVAALGGSTYAAATITGPSSNSGWEVVQSSPVDGAPIGCPDGKRMLASGGSATPAVSAWAVCAPRK
jgi:hypothetical protein